MEAKCIIFFLLLLKRNTLLYLLSECFVTKQGKDFLINVGKEYLSGMHMAPPQRQSRAVTALIESTNAVRFTMVFIDKK